MVKKVGFKKYKKKIKKNVHLSKRVGKHGVFLGLVGLLLGISFGKYLGAALSDFKKKPSLLFYLT